MIKNIFKEIEELFFPTNCIICSKGSNLICEKCLEGAETKKVYDSSEYDFLDKILILGNYQNTVIKKMIWEMKYNFNKEIAKVFSVMLLDKFKNEINNEFVFISVPLHRKRYNFRGFNQSDLVARHLSKNTGLKYLENAIRKNKNTQNQMELSKEKRLKNNFGVFEVRRLVKSKNIYLLDDVITTGSTLKECARVLKEAGANEVWGVVLAKD